MDNPKQIAAASVIMNQLREDVTPSDNNLLTLDTKTDGHSSYMKFLTITMNHNINLRISQKS